MCFWKYCRKSWHEHGVNNIDGMADRLLRVCRSGAGSVLQAGRESYRFAQGHDEANDLAGSSFLGIELVAWTLVLEQVPLSIAFPLMALTYITIVVAGALVLKEPINIRHAVGACLITAGVACVGATGL
jgi:multidrug transporter EmrE-like cation transporter